VKHQGKAENSRVLTQKKQGHPRTVTLS